MSPGKRKGEGEGEIEEATVYWRYAGEEGKVKESREIESLPRYAEEEDAAAHRDDVMALEEKKKARQQKEEESQPKHGEVNGNRTEQIEEQVDNTLKHDIIGADTEINVTQDSDIEAISVNFTKSVREQLLIQVSNEKLRNCINQLYRNNANIGDGGLADAIRYEITTGKLVGNKSHIQKGLERVKNLENIISKQNLSKEELAIAKQLLEKLKEALKLGEY